MTINPLDIAINNSLYSRIHAAPINDKMLFALHKICGSCQGKPYFNAAVIVSFTASLVTSTFAFIETISSLAYASLATLVHLSMTCQSRTWQNHVIESWAFCKHSALGIAAPLWVIKYRNMDLHEIIQNRQFYKMECAQKMQKIGKTFDGVACRVHQVGEYKQQKLEIALEGFHQMIGQVYSYGCNRITFIQDIKQLGYYEQVMDKLSTIPEAEVEKKELLEDILSCLFQWIPPRIYEIFHTKLDLAKIENYRFRVEEYIKASIRFILSNERYLNMIGGEEIEEDDRHVSVKENIEELFLIQPVNFFAVLLEVIELENISRDQWGIESLIEGEGRIEKMEKLVKDYSNFQHDEKLQNLLLRHVLKEKDFDITKDSFIDKETNEVITIAKEEREIVINFFKLIGACAEPFQRFDNLDKIAEEALKSLNN